MTALVWDVMTRARVEVKPGEAEPVQRRTTPALAGIRLARDLDRARLAQRRGRLLVLPAVGAVDHDELRPSR